MIWTPYSFIEEYGPLFLNKNSRPSYHLVDELHILDHYVCKTPWVTGRSRWLVKTSGIDNPTDRHEFRQLLRSKVVLHALLTTYERCINKDDIMCAVNQKGI